MIPFPVRASPLLNWFGDGFWLGVKDGEPRAWHSTADITVSSITGMVANARFLWDQVKN